MKSNEDILSSILKTTQMGQTGIRAVLGYAVKPGLKQALRDQLHEYDNIEQDALDLANQKGWSVEELASVAKTMSKMYTHCNLKFGNVDSKIAAMMIQGNTRGMIKGLKNLHHGKSIDDSLAALSHKLLNCEKANIKQMQGFV
jgi:hypothetical protein